MKLQGRCLECYKGKLVHDWDRWHKCDNPLCHGDSDDVVDGYGYPTLRRGTMCKEYTAVKDLDVSRFTAGQTITFKTSKGTKKKAVVIHIDKDDNKMIIQEEGKKKVKLLIDNQRIANSYDALFPENKKIYGGWWHRRITIMKR